MAVLSDAFGFGGHNVALAFTNPGLLAVIVSHAETFGRTVIFMHQSPKRLQDLLARERRWGWTGE
jgi:hypothetical protein